MDRLYKDKNSHYIEQSTEQKHIECQLCNKIYMVDECEIINKKTIKPFNRNRQLQLLPAVS